MILDFPDLDTLQLALSSGVVPKEVAASAADARVADDGRVLVDVDGIRRPTLKALKQLGVKGRRSIGGESVRRVQCWPQILPLQPDTNGIPDDDKTTVLFDLPDDGLLPVVVNEVLRLGNDRQSFRAFEVNGESRILLKIIGPPYYSLLRALDRDGRSASPRAYVEQHDRVWVQVGHSHPLADRFSPPPGRMLLISSPDEWTFLEEGRFREIYETAEFELPGSPTKLREVAADQPIDVPLQLVRGGGSESAEMWVLNHNAYSQLDAFVQQAEDKLIARLSFAIGEATGEETIVVRLRPGKGAPPVLVLDAIACCPYLKLPNLFVPVGQRLHPPLRRDVVKSLLAEDDAAITWLVPGDEGAFTPQSINESAFRPLEDWVRYVIDREREPLEAWMRSTRFDFEPFICPDDKPDPAKSKRGKGERSPDSAPGEKRPKSNKPGKKKSLIGKLFDKKKRDGSKPRRPARVVKRKPSEIEQRLRALQAEFLKSEDPLDAPGREPQWREMATLNAALRRYNDAAACWSHAFWETDAPNVDDLADWYRQEAHKWEFAEQLFDDVKAVEHHFDDLLSSPNPGPSAVNAAAVFLIWHAAADNRRFDFDAQLGGLQQLFETNERHLPVRTAWLTWCALSRLAGGDVLMLARARDRLLDRLLQRGLVPNQDLPAFLYNSGAHTGERIRVVRDQLAELHHSINTWCRKTLGTAAPETSSYVDLIFAWGMSRLGETAHCERLREAAGAKLQSNDVHSWLFRAFNHRIQQGLDGSGGTGQLPPELLEELEVMERMERYKADRLRQHSMILEPHERIEPYRRWHQRHSDDLGRQLAELSDIADRDELTVRLETLLKESHPPANAVRVIATAMELAPRLGEAMANDCLPRVSPLLRKLPDAVDRATLLERGLFLAAHFDQQRWIETFLAELRSLLQRKIHTSLKTIESMEAVLAQSFRGLRRMGMRDGVLDLLNDLDALVRDFEKRAPQRRTNTGETEEPLLVLMQVAAGWLYFGRDDNAWPILDRVRAILFLPQANVKAARRTSLAVGYVRTLSQAPVETALPRLTELFEKLDHISGGYTTNSHYGLPQIDIVEATMLAMVSDDFTQDKNSRRWMDDDEYLVRRRIHRDVRELTG